MLIRRAKMDVVQHVVSVMLANDGRHNAWSKAAVAQGFSWRAESVTFEVISDSCELSLEVCTEDVVNTRDDAVRAILVPFVVTEGSKVEVADMYFGSVVDVAVPPGAYGLLYEIGYPPGSVPDEDDDFRDMWCRLTFVPGTFEARALRRDSRLHPDEPLVLDGTPA